MRDLILPVIVSIDTLEELELRLLNLFTSIKETENSLGYVSGIITSDGPEHIQANLIKLASHTDKIRSLNSFPVFSATDIFSDEIFNRLKPQGYKNSDYEVFWDNIIRAKHITDIFMTPRWEKSHGCNLEHAAAIDLKLKIHYL